jgi:hypothetical protein
MKCNKCGNNIDIKMAAKVACQGCKILTSMTTIMTVECAQCGEKFQLPVSSGEFIVKEDE